MTGIFLCLNKYSKSTLSSQTSTQYIFALTHNNTLIQSKNCPATNRSGRLFFLTFVACFFQTDVLTAAIKTRIQSWHRGGDTPWQEDILYRRCAAARCGPPAGTGALPGAQRCVPELLYGNGIEIPAGQGPLHTLPVPLQPGRDMPPRGGCALPAQRPAAERLLREYGYSLRPEAYYSAHAPGEHADAGCLRLARYHRAGYRMGQKAAGHHHRRQGRPPGGRSARWRAYLQGGAEAER